MNVDWMADWRSGQRVRYVGIHGREDGPVGRVSRALRGGVRVRWDDGRIEDIHPDSLRHKAVEAGYLTDQERTK